MYAQVLTFYMILCTITRSDSSRVRLVDGRNNYEGRLQVYHNFVWGNVCDDEFTVRSASVFCKMLGLSKDGSFYTHKGGKKSTMLESVKCRGRGHAIMSCYNNGWGNYCSHDEDVGIRCDKTKPIFTLSAVTQGILTLPNNGNSFAICNKNVPHTLPSIVCNSYGLAGTNHVFTSLSSKYRQYYDGLYCIDNAEDFSECSVIPRTSKTCDEGFVGVKCIRERLIAGNTPFAGRLQVWHDGVWGNVCDDGFDNNAASVVCRSIGLSWNGQFSSEYKGGTTAFILDDVSCVGTESSIVNCRHSSWKSTNCDHRQDVGINCSPCSDKPETVDLALVGGPTEHEGFAQIKLGKYMSNICSDDFDHNDAKVFCREMIGTESAAVVSGSLYQKTTSLVMQESFHCTGNETKLLHCPRISVSSCPQHHKAAIVCNPTPASASLEVPTVMIVNDTVNVTCTATGANPTPLIWWNCSGLTSPTTLTLSPHNVTSILTITPSYLFNGEKCSCFVHQVETVFPKIALTEILDVHYPVLDGLNVTAPILTENEMGNLTCEVSTGNPLPVLWWECTGVPDQDVTLETTPLLVKAILHVAAVRKFNGKLCTCHGRQMNTSFPQVMESAILNVHYEMDRKVSLSSPELIEGKPEFLVCKAAGGNPRPIVKMACTGILRHGSQVSLRYLTLSVLSVLPTIDLDGQNCTCHVYQPSTNFQEVHEAMTLSVFRLDETDSVEHSSTTTSSLQLKEDNIIKTVKDDNTSTKSKSSYAWLKGAERKWIL